MFVSVMVHLAKEFNYNNQKHLLKQIWQLRGKKKNT